MTIPLDLGPKLFVIIYFLDSLCHSTVICFVHAIPLLLCFRILRNVIHFGTNVALNGASVLCRCTV